MSSVRFIHSNRSGAECPSHLSMSGSLLECRCCCWHRCYQHKSDLHWFIKLVLVVCAFLLSSHERMLNILFIYSLLPLLRLNTRPLQLRDRRSRAAIGSAGFDHHLGGPRRRPVGGKGAGLGKESGASDLQALLRRLHLALQPNPRGADQSSPHCLQLPVSLRWGKRTNEAADGQEITFPQCGICAISHIYEDDEGTTSLQGYGLKGHTRALAHYLQIVCMLRYCNHPTKSFNFCFLMKRVLQILQIYIFLWGRLLGFITPIN